MVVIYAWFHAHEFWNLQSDDERLYDGKSTKGALDTIAFGNNGVLAIDATNSPPKEEKIDKIRNSASYISENYRFK
jgi:hypothetical protein